MDDLVSREEPILNVSEAWSVSLWCLMMGMIFVSVQLLTLNEAWKKKQTNPQMAEFNLHMCGTAIACRIIYQPAVKTEALLLQLYYKWIFRFTQISVFSFLGIYRQPLEPIMTSKVPTSVHPACPL